MILTALIMGFAGSLHCFGMCSPLVMAATTLKPSIILSKLVYNAGRIFSYAILGMIVASVGLVFPNKNYQNLFSILLGITLVSIALGGIKNYNIPFLTIALQSISVKLKTLFGHFINQKNYGSLLFLGCLNGLLPCGLTYIALSYCITLKGPFDGFNFMLLFGAGTLPVMLGFTSIIQFIVKRFHFNTSSITTSILILSGIALIARVFIIHLPQAPSFKEGMMDIVLCR